jgi:hypothetical protein
MIEDQRERRFWRTSKASCQAAIASTAFVLIASKFVPYPLPSLASYFPPFAIGSFTSDLLFLSICIHMLLIASFGTKPWIRAISFAAQLAVFLVFCSIALQSLFDLVITSMHKLHLDFGLFTFYVNREENTELQYAAAALQQPLYIMTILPACLAMLSGFQSLVDSFDVENFAVSHLRRSGHLKPVGLFLAATYYFARCFNHVAHFVVPMAVEILREERFESDIRADLIDAIKTFFLPEAVIRSLSKLINRLGRTVCGAMLLGIEYVPMWSTQVVTVLMRGTNDDAN